MEPTALVGGAGGTANVGAGPTTSSGGHSQGGGGENAGGEGGENVGGTGGAGGAGGCGADLTSDLDNCGECGRACLVNEQVTTPRCIDGHCKSFCASGFVNINTPVMGPDDGCETPGRRVFVTQETTTGDTLGGLAGADMRCQTTADMLELGGKWAAWLSDGVISSTVAQRFITAPDAPYMLLDFTPVADSWTALTTSGPTHSIDMTENQVTLTNVQVKKVWTGTNPAGGGTLSDCAGWSDLALVGTVGDLSQINDGWTQAGPISCNQLARLYCFEQ